MRPVPFQNMLQIYYETALGFLFQVQVQKTFRHLLNTRVLVPPQPSRARQIEFQIAMFDGPVILFADIAKNKSPARNRRGSSWLGPRSCIGRGGNRESYCVPESLRGNPRTTARISQVAKCFQNVLGRKVTFVTGRGTVTAPSSTKRKPGRMGPRAIFQSCHRHEVRAGHAFLSGARIVGTANCNQLRKV